MSYVGSMMDGSAVVYRPNPNYDARRGVTQLFLPVDWLNGGVAANRLEPDPLPCSVQQASPRDMMLYGQRNAEFSTTLVFDRDPKCQMNDQIRVTDYIGTVSYYLCIGAAKPNGRGQQWVVNANYVDQPHHP